MRPENTAGGHNERAATNGRGLALTPPGDPQRQVPKLLGRANAGVAELIGLSVPDARHHVHVQGVTGTGKSTWLAHHVLGEAEAGRGVVLLDPQGDLARNVIQRLPASCVDRLVLLDPDETEAPPAFNVLHAEPSQRELVADGVVSVFRRLYAASWGPRMDDLMRAACLTLIRREGSTVADIVPLLQRPAFRDQVLAEVGEPEGLEGFWQAFNEATPAQRAQLCAPVASRLRGVLTRRFARTLLGAERSTFTLADVLDGGILIARLPKGHIGEDCARLVGSLLIAGLWQEITRRAARPAEARPDATIVVDECQNFLHLPIGVEDALAEARGYRVSLVLAHQHLAQLPPDVREGIDANARNKVYFTVSPDDARKLVRHVAPDMDEHALRRRPAFEVVARIIADGRDTSACTLDTLPLPPTSRGREHTVRQAARRRTGLPLSQRQQAGGARKLNTTPTASTAAQRLRQHWNNEDQDEQDHGNSVGNSVDNWAGNL